MPYHHLTREMRIELGALRSAGLSQKEIAAQLRVNPSTVCRELARHRSSNQSGYHARSAIQAARAKRARANQLRTKLLCEPGLRRYVSAKLLLEWSPEQIAGRLQLQNRATTVSYGTIYSWIYGYAPYLKGHLRHQGTQYRRRHGSKNRALRREALRKRSIDARPLEASDRRRVGDWEGDTVVGTDRKSRLLTYTDRRSGFELAAKLSGITADEVCQATQQLFAAIPAARKHTLTLDNGIEFNPFEYIEDTTGLTIYFAHPYHSWERGTNENTNGLLRQYFAKKTPLTGVTQAQLDTAVRRLNTRPRKRLGYRTPREVFAENCTSD